MLVLVAIVVAFYLMVVKYQVRRSLWVVLCGAHFSQVVFIPKNENAGEW